MTSQTAHDDLPLTQRLLLRPTEAAAVLGLSRSTLYELLRAGELPVVHVGRAVRIPTRDLQEWIAQRSRALTPRRGSAAPERPPARQGQWKSALNG